MADYEPLHLPGNALTRTTSAAVVGGQLLAVSGSGTVAPTSAATAGWLGAAAFDAPSGALVGVFDQGILRLVAAGTITAGNTVEAAASGQIAQHTLGTNDTNIVGVALTSGTVGQLIEVSLH